MNNTYKYLIVKEAILKEIKEGRLSPGEKLKSEEEYAQEYQVSLITIRKALTELTTDGYITRIRKKGTFVNNAPTEPAHAASHLIAVIISANERYDISYMKIIKGIQAMASQQNYSVLIEWCDRQPHQEETAIRKMLTQNVEGFLLYLSDPKQNRYMLSLIEERNLPYVLIDRCDHSYPCYYAGCDNFTGGLLATEELIKAHHTKIAFAAYEFFLPSEQTRYDGFLCAMIKAGIPVDHHNLIRDVDKDVLAEQIKRREFTAIFCCNDRLALNTIQGLARAGLTIAQDYSIIGFDEWDDSLNKAAGLTTIRQDFQEVGRNSFYLLHSAIQGVLTGNHTKMISGVSIIRRTSVATCEKY